MGHTSARMIEKHYGTWINEEKPDMAKQVSNILRDLKKQNECLGAITEPIKKAIQPK